MSDASACPPRLRRPFIFEGDTTTVGGRVEATSPSSPLTYGRSGKRSVLEGDPVWCPACDSYGVTKCVQPYHPNTHGEGKRQANLDGDLCLCRCPTPPRLVAGQQTYAMSFSVPQVAQLHGADRWAACAGYEPLTNFDQHFVIMNDKTGKPTSNFAYVIRTPDGTYTGDLYEDGTTAKVYADEAQTVELLALLQTSIGLGNHD